MNMKHLAVAAAIGSLLSMGSTTSLATDAAKEKCFGVAKAGENDCAANGHACAGHSAKDMDPSEWKYVPMGECEKMGGKPTAT